MPVYNGYLPVYFKACGIFGTPLYKPHCIFPGTCSRIRLRAQHAISTVTTHITLYVSA